MKNVFYIPLALLLAGCSCVGCDPWANIDYTLAECGTKEAILTTTGCQQQAATSQASVANVNDVGRDAAEAVHTHENQAMKR